MLIFCETDLIQLTNIWFNKAILGHDWHLVKWVYVLIFFPYNLTNISANQDVASYFNKLKHSELLWIFKH